MSRPRNNLDELQRKHAAPGPTPTSPSKPSTPHPQSAKGKFKPARSIPTSTPANVTVRKLPSFSTPGWNKVRPPPLQCQSTADNGISYVEVSSTESTPLNASTSSIPTKRLSGTTEDFPPYSSTKRPKTDHPLEKENIFVAHSADKGKGRARDPQTPHTLPLSVAVPLRTSTPASQNHTHTLPRSGNAVLTLRAAFEAIPHEAGLDEKSEKDLKAAVDTAQTLMETCDTFIGTARADPSGSKDVELLELLSDFLEKRQAAARSRLKARQRGERPIEIPQTPVQDDDLSFSLGPEPLAPPFAGLPNTLDSDDHLWDSFSDDPTDFTDLTADSLPSILTPATPPATQPRAPAPRAPSPPLEPEPVTEPIPLTRRPYFPKVHDALTKTFKKEAFRPKQCEAVCAAMEGRDVFVLFPTGSGKSLTFQIPAVCGDGITVVISPLVSLMRDQVDALLEYGVDVVMLSGNMADPIKTEVRQRLTSRDRPKLLYITPEQLQISPWMRKTLQWYYDHQQLDRFVVDEAHCITDWGRRFRDSYTQLTEIRKLFPECPISAFTATANPQVEADIISRLGMKNPARFKLSFNRKNLDYEVRLKKTGRSCIEEISDFITSNHPKDTGIIYCHSRKNCEDIAKSLREDFGLHAKHYHADMDAGDRERVQREWSRGQVPIIVATVAFGMGIDKADVRYVIHHALPATLANYYQETGRAGRDGKLAKCILYYSWGDASSRIEMIRKERAEKQEEEIQWMEDDLWHVVRYCANDVRCRRQQVLDYFGEVFDTTLCNGMCNNCRDPTPVQAEDHTENAMKAMKLFESLSKNGGELTRKMLSQVLKGSRDRALIQKGFDKDTLYGACKDLTTAVVERIVDEMIFEGILTTMQVQKGEYSQTYITLGRKAHLLRSRKLSLKIEFRITARKDAGKARQRKPRTKAAPESVNSAPTSVSGPSAAGSSRTHRAKPPSYASPGDDEHMLSLYRDDEDPCDDDIEISSPAPKRRPATRAWPSASQPLAESLDSDIEEIDNPVVAKVTLINQEDVVNHTNDDAVMGCKDELLSLREEVRKYNPQLAEIINDEVIGILAAMLPNDGPTLLTALQCVNLMPEHLGQWRGRIQDICTRYHMQQH